MLSETYDAFEIVGYVCYQVKSLTLDAILRRFGL